MRNLKKILALVLALVMSLSLMATAGAADAAATSSETVTPAYEIALQVLGKDGLKVFGGYTDGTIRPQNNITRAEVAAILYRIVTGDVTDAQAGIYTDMANVNFNDLTGANWAKGYINYCANAQLIVGVGGNQFKPLANITGYATLAMILRALGYDKNGEFKGSGWEIRTASKARELGILKNVSENQLGSSATRELVAELLFRAMLCDKVTYNALTQDYDKTGVTLGYDVFSLEEVEGVVVANEYADLRRDADGKGTDKTAADDTTVLRDAAGKDRIVTVASGLEDLGETRVAYTIENGKRNQYDLKNVKLENPGTDSITYDGGEEFSSISSKITGSEAEHYVNFGENFSNVTTTIKVTYQVRQITTVIPALTAQEAREDFADTYHLNGLPAAIPADLPGHLVAEPSYLGSGSYTVTYTPKVGDIVDDASGAVAPRTISGHTYSVENIRENGVDVPYYRVQIAPNSTFDSFDVSIVRAIFNRADRLPENARLGELVVTGEVFRGTQSVYDYSDWRSYESFREDCLKESEENTNVSSNGKGYWLKIIDNGNDGVTDWVFQTRYTMASVSAVKDGVPTLETEVSWGAPDAMNVMSRASSTTDESGDLAVGDVVYYAVIDGVARAWKADVVEGRVNTVNRTNETVTTTDGTTYEQSANHEHSARVDIFSGVVNMSGTTNYKMYLDKYGYMAAFSQDISGKFVLLTNGWFQTLKNGVEYAVTAWDSETKAFAQYDITSGGNLFVNPNTGDGSNSWNRILRFPNVNCNDVNHTTAATTDDLHTIVAYMETEGENATLTPVDNVYDTERLNGQAKRMIDMGTRIPYSNVENGVLQTTTTTARQPYDTRGPVRTGDSATERVRALSTTTYYFVYRTWNIGNNVDGTEGGSLYVQQITGYEDASKYLVTTTDDAAHIEDVYVVGTRATDVFGTYYAADVVVVELDDTFYLRHHEQEEVFIYDFPVVGTTAKIEEVCAIRADGTKDEHLKIDLTGLRTYTEVTTGNLRYAPGLYYLTRTARTDSEGIWEVDPMTHEQIRNSRHYDAGTVVASDFTMPANYAEIRDWVCLGSAFAGDTHARAAAVMTTYTNHTRKNVEGSDYYNLSISPATGVGTATETTASDCLRQLSGSNVTSDYNWNQVLVRYDKDTNEIVYAISFAHTGANASGATVENLAQAAWRSVLMDQGRAAGIRSFIFTLPPTAFTLALDEDVKLTDVVDTITVNEVKATPNADGTFTVANIYEQPTYTIKVTLNNKYTGTLELDAKYVTKDGTLATLVKNTDAENTYTLTIRNASVFDEFTSKENLRSIVQIVFNGDKIVEADPLAPAKETAKTQVAGYEKDKVAALTGEDATAATKAKTDAEAAIDAADTEAKITAAVDAYKKAIDALITPEEPEQVTVTFDVTKEDNSVASWEGTELTAPAAVKADDGETIKLNWITPAKLVSNDGKDQLHLMIYVDGADEAITEDAYAETGDVTYKVTGDVKIMYHYYKLAVKAEDQVPPETPSDKPSIPSGGDKGDGTEVLPRARGTVLAITLPGDDLTAARRGWTFGDSTKNIYVVNESSFNTTFVDEKYQGSKLHKATEAELANAPEWVKNEEKFDSETMTWWCFVYKLVDNKYVSPEYDYGTAPDPTYTVTITNNAEADGVTVTTTPDTLTGLKKDTPVTITLAGVPETKTAKVVAGTETLTAESDGSYKLTVTDDVTVTISLEDKTDPLATERAAALKTVAEWKEAELALLPDTVENANAIKNARNTATAMINAKNATKESIQLAVDNYKKAIAALVPTLDETIGTGDAFNKVGDTVVGEDAEHNKTIEESYIDGQGITVKKTTTETAQGFTETKLAATVPASAVTTGSKNLTEANLASKSTDDSVKEAAAALKKANSITDTQKDLAEVANFEVYGPENVPPTITAAAGTYVIATRDGQKAVYGQQTQAVNETAYWTWTVNVYVVVTVTADAITPDNAAAAVNFNITFQNMTADTTAALAAAKKILTDGEVEEAEVQTEYTALVDAINAAKTPEDLAKIYNGTNLIGTEATKLQTAVALVNAKKNLIKGIDGMLTAKKIAAADVKTEYDALKTVINSATDSATLAGLCSISGTGAEATLTGSAATALNNKITFLTTKAAALEKAQAMVDDANLSPEKMEAAGIEAKLAALVARIEAATPENIASIYAAGSFKDTCTEYKILDNAIKDSKKEYIANIFAAPLHDNKAGDDHTGDKNLVDGSTYTATYTPATETANGKVVVNASGLKMHWNAADPNKMGYWAGFFVENPVEAPDSNGTMRTVTGVKAAFGNSIAEVSSVGELDPAYGHGTTTGVGFYYNDMNQAPEYRASHKQVTFQWFGKNDDNEDTALGTPVTLDVTWNCNFSTDPSFTVMKANLHDTANKVTDAEICDGYTVSAKQIAWDIVEVDVTAKDLHEHQNASDMTKYWLGFGALAPATVDGLTVTVNGTVDTDVTTLAPLNTTTSDNNDTQNTTKKGFVEYFSIPENSESTYYEVKVEYKVSETVAATITYRVTFHVDGFVAAASDPSGADIEPASLEIPDVVEGNEFIG